MPSSTPAKKAEVDAAKEEGGSSHSVSSQIQQYSVHSACVMEVNKKPREVPLYGGMTEESKLTDMTNTEKMLSEANQMKSGFSSQLSNQS